MAAQNFLFISIVLILILLADCKIISGNYVKLPTPTPGKDQSFNLQLERITNVGNSTFFAAAKCVEDPLCFYYCQTTDALNNLVAYRYNYNAKNTTNIENLACSMVPSK